MTFSDGRGYSAREDRLRATLAAVLLAGALGYALAVGLAVDMPHAIDDGLAVFGVPTERPAVAKRIVPPARRSRRAEGAAAPPNLHATATVIVAPPSTLPIVIPPPVVVAPKAGTGDDASAGAADVVGPGTGSGGEGDGLGGGGAGDGDGGGMIGETPPRLTRGRLRDSDYPHDIGEAGVGGTVGVRYVVETDGRVRDCRATRSSGNAELDSLTCRLIAERFRFKPSLDRFGRPVPAVIVENHSWVVEDEPEEPPQR